MLFNAQPTAKVISGRHTQTETERDTEIKSNKQRYREAHKETDRHREDKIDNWFLTPSQPRRSYQGDSQRNTEIQTDRQTDREVGR